MVNNQGSSKLRGLLERMGGEGLKLNSYRRSLRERRFITVRLDRRGQVRRGGAICGKENIERLPQSRNRDVSWA